jgi:flagellar FliL protein
MADEENEVLEEEEEPKKGRGGKVFLWIVISVVALSASGYGAYSLVKYYQGAPAPEEGGDAEAEEGGLEAVKSTMSLEPFLVNLADSENGSRLVKATFHLGLNRSGLGEELASDPVVLAATRDRINTILCTKTSDQMLSSDGKERLRAEIRDGVNELIQEGEVLEVYIIDFIVQL